MCVFVRVLVVFVNSEIFGIIVKMSDVCSWLVALKKCKCNSKWILKYNFYLFIIRTATIKIVGYLHSGTNKYRSFHDPMCYTAPNWFQDSVSVLSVVLGLFMNLTNVTSKFNDGQQHRPLPFQNGPPAIFGRRSLILDDFCRRLIQNSDIFNFIFFIW